MSMTIGEAGAVNDLIERLSGTPSAPYAGLKLASDDRLVEAVRLLAAKASRVLMAGYDADRAEAAVRAWLDRQAAPAPEVAAPAPEASAWEQAAARCLLDVLDGLTVAIRGEVWEVGTEDSEGYALDGDRAFLVNDDDGRQVTVRLHVELVEGSPC